jgi:hypothetical protein
VQPRYDGGVLRRLRTAEQRGGLGFRGARGEEVKVVFHGVVWVLGDSGIRSGSRTRIVGTRDLVLKRARSLRKRSNSNLRTRPGYLWTRMRWRCRVSLTRCRSNAPATGGSRSCALTASECHSARQTRTRRHRTRCPIPPTHGTLVSNSRSLTRRSRTVTIHSRADGGAAAAVSRATLGGTDVRRRHSGSLSG